ncbi:hypothetical protein [Pseudomonas bijieensis]|nr:hypothetical protein [Pseudomonas bijieensis]
MRTLVIILGALTCAGILWRQEGYFIYHRPASSFAAWGMNA